MTTHESRIAKRMITALEHVPIFCQGMPAEVLQSMISDWWIKYGHPAYAGALAAGFGKAVAKAEDLP